MRGGGTRRVKMTVIFCESRSRMTYLTETVAAGTREEPPESTHPERGFFCFGLRERKTFLPSYDRDSSGKLVFVGFPAQTSHLGRVTHTNLWTRNEDMTLRMMRSKQHLSTSWSLFLMEHGPRASKKKKSTLTY